MAKTESGIKIITSNKKRILIISLVNLQNAELL